MPNLDIGAMVRSEREAAGMTRAVLAERANMSASTVLRLEVHGLLPSHVRLVRIARVLGIPLDRFTEDLEREAS